MEPTMTIGTNFRWGFLNPVFFAGKLNAGNSRYPFTSPKPSYPLPSPKPEQAPVIVPPQPAPWGDSAPTLSQDYKRVCLQEKSSSPIPPIPWKARGGRSSYPLW